MNSTEEEQWNKITKMFDAIGIDIESVFNHIESLLGVKVEQNSSISTIKNSFRLKIFLHSLTCFIDHEVKCDFSFQKACKLTTVLTFSKI